MRDFIQTLPKLILKVVLWFLPKRARNMVCIISLMQYVHGSEQLSDNTLQSINEVMNFGYSAQASKFPTIISKAIWRTAENDKLCHPNGLCAYRSLGPQEIDNVIALAKRGNRKWNLYHDETELRKDLEALFSQHQSKVFSQV